MWQDLEATLPDPERGTEPIVVGVSGGADSTVALIALARALGADSVLAAHFDHGLRSREEARTEAAFVRTLADQLGVGALVGRPRRRPEDRSEAAAREARYRWLAAACRRAGSRRCVTGHTLDDQAETVLMRLVRGAGSLGAAGMASVSPWPVLAARGRSLTVMRPLLGVTRREVEEYLGALDLPGLGLEVVQDASNRSPEYARNRLRHEVMPTLLHVNPRAPEHLAAFAESSRADDEALTAIACTWLAEHASPTGGREVEQSVELPRRAIAALPRAVAMRVLREAMARIDLVPESSHLRSLVAVMGRAGAHVDLRDGTASTHRDVIRLQRTP